MDYLHGSIVRIKLKDFLTYDAVEFRPGPKLNVIIGPNGSGKSTIVCAICLGLGGKPNAIGRAAYVSAFIKLGCSKAYVEIELFNNDGDNFVISREIRKDNTSVWMLNKELTSHKMIDDLMAELNIQIGNLCQIMPQDKVADFVKMTQQELLENTEKTVGAENMYQRHVDLKLMQSKMKSLKTSHQSNANLLESEIQKNSRLEEEVKNFQERQKYLDKIELLNKKKPWIEYDNIRQLHNQMKVKADELLKDLRQLYDDAKPQEDIVKERKEKLKNCEDKISAIMKNIREHELSITQTEHILESHSDKLAEIDGDFKSTESVEMQRQVRCNGLKKQLESLESELNSLTINTDIVTKIHSTSSEIQQVVTEQIQVQSELETTTAELNNVNMEIKKVNAELAKVQDVKHRRLELLRQKDRHAYEAVQWLRQSGHNFKKVIHEPIMTLINVSDPSSAIYIENHISRNDLFAFVCEDPEDMNEFLFNTRDQRRLNISAVLAPTEPLQSFRPQNSIEDFQNYGFRSYLKDLFTAPDAVVAYLCRQYRIHQTPVGNQKTKEIVQRVIQETNFTNFYTANHHYTSKRSKYSQNISTMNRELSQPSLLTVTLNTERVRHLENTLKTHEENMSSLEGNCSNLKKTADDLIERATELRELKRELVKDRDKRANCVTKISQKEESIKRCDAEAVDLERERKLTNDQLRSVLEKKSKTIKTLSSQIKSYCSLHHEKVFLNMKEATAKLKTTRAEDEYRRMSSHAEEKERELENYKEQLQQTKNNAKRLLNAAKAATNLEINQGIPLELKGLFAKLPEDIQEINTMIYENQALADVLLQTDKNVILEYQKRQRDIAQLTKSTEDQRLEVENLQSQIDQLKEQWLPALETTVKKIDENFSRFFSSLGCAGEVGLKKGDNNQDEFDKYAINIRVKYRDSEELRDLTCEQSGGERSVATILYMMALQELTRVPFRCVDEINQGMDSTNERKVFELMVETSCRDDTAQYFLLTPKLLPDLNFGENMTVLCVYNSTYIPSHAEWDINKFLTRRANLDLVEDNEDED